MSQKNLNKKKIIKLYNLLFSIYNHTLEKKNKDLYNKEKYELIEKNILEIQDNLKNQKNIYQHLYQQKYFNELLNIIFEYYEEVRNIEAELIYNDLLSLLETSFSSG